MPMKMKMQMRDTSHYVMSKAKTSPDQCFFRTKTGQFKQYTVSIVDGAIQFCRSKKGNQECEVSYPVNTFQVAIGSSQS